MRAQIQEGSRTSRTYGSARDRLLAVADELFFTNGIHNTGVTLLIERANIAKASFYASFKSKNDLVDAYLERQHSAIIERLENIARNSDSLPEKISQIFDLLSDSVARTAYRGCLFFVAAIEQPQSDLAAQRWVRAHKLEVLSVFRRICEDAEHPQAEETAQQLAIIYDGALVTAAVRPESDAIKRGRGMALTLVGAD